MHFCRHQECPPKRPVRLRLRGERFSTVKMLKLASPALMVLATLCVGLVGVWAEIVWPAVAALIVLGTISLVVTLSAGRGTRAAAAALVVAWGCSLVGAPGLLFPGGKVFTLGPMLALLAWCMAVVALPAACSAQGAGVRRGWKVLCLAWSWFGVSIWLGSSYLRDQMVPFLAGLVLSLALLIVCKRWFRMPALAVQSVNTLIVLIVGLPMLDFLIWPPVRLTEPSPARHLYLYRVAERDPTGFKEWCAEYDAQLDSLWKGLFKPDPTDKLPYLVRRGARHTFFQSPIRINKRGFRGPAIPSGKGRTYRIVALGESSTFGFTLNRGDKTWPVLLQQMIRQRLDLSRPVEVINAGLPGFCIEDNLHRLARDILPLKPDMVISYHGYNGFFLIHPALPRVCNNAPPAYRDRPLKILANCEYRLRLMLAEHREVAKLYRHPIRLADPLNNRYARDYLALIQAAQTNHFKLVLANFSMAVNAHTDLDVVQFYRQRFPVVFWQIKANEVHSTIVRRLAESHTNVFFVDTHPGLDGKCDEFIDLVHFDQAGRRQLAENIFAGITNILEEELSADNVASR